MIYCIATFLKIFIMLIAMIMIITIFCKKKIDIYVLDIHVYLLLQMILILDSIKFYTLIQIS